VELRQKARVDLEYLCRDVLNFKDVSREVHGAMLDHLQKFEGGKDDVSYLEYRHKGYTPKVAIEDLVGTRRRLILISRGCLKSTVATTAHTIQFILNYPNIRILLSTGTGEKGRLFLQDIKKEFQHNVMLRWLFPELCPQGNVAQWGTQEAFTVEGRADYCKYNKLRTVREPTVMTCSIEKQIAGFHFEVIKNDDLIDEMNVRTPEQIATVKKHFGLLLPLLENVQKHWIDLVGTIYHYNDLHYSIVSAQEQNHAPEGKCTRAGKCSCVWSTLVQPACEDYPNGKLLWPARLSLEALKNIEDDPNFGPAVLYPQYLLNPMPTSASLVDSESDIVWIPRSELNKIYPMLDLHITVDLAGMEAGINSDNDYTVMNLHGFDHDGRLYVLEVWRNRTEGYEEVINQMFRMSLKHPRLIDIKIQKDNFLRVLQPFLIREQTKREHRLPIVPTKIPNTRNYKVQKIKRLRPFFLNGTVRLAEDLVGGSPSPKRSCTSRRGSMMTFWTR
jgi:hypothetical protein